MRIVVSREFKGSFRGAKGDNLIQGRTFAERKATISIWGRRDAPGTGLVRSAASREFNTSFRGAKGDNLRSGTHFRGAKGDNLIRGRTFAGRISALNRAGRTNGVARCTINVKPGGMNGRSVEAESIDWHHGRRWRAEGRALCIALEACGDFGHGHDLAGCRIVGHGNNSARTMLGSNSSKIRSGRSSLFIVTNAMVRNRATARRSCESIRSTACSRAGDQGRLWFGVSPNGAC